ncbi:MAG: arsenic efflux protein [Calditrichaceae bacterium]|nr:arsenic efflux protein [Calditrichaceae bacterium]MBN2709297.1 arsenic efflux protein [Calditrichaceae bacterium]RQV92006.1 MAG: hypothetical protein EH224_16720 [Calditrichota bacterium]
MVIEVVEHALMITSFVFIMMLLIEYLNVQTRGRWQESLKNNRWGQYILAVFLGAMPGCLGAFSVVSLYSHRVVSFGALTATMIATSGDEAFVMFSMFPLKALWLTILLAVTGVAVGYITDLLYKKQHLLIEHLGHIYPMHANDKCRCFSISEIWQQLKNISFQRTLLIGIFIVFLAALFTDHFGHHGWGWERITFTLGAVFGLFVVCTVPDHFLERHLWEHVVKKHLPRIFLWTLGALIVIHFLERYIDVDAWIRDNHLLVLLIAVAVGIIPESGPHLLFVTLYAGGSLPFGILLASSIVQDGHGMLPMLAVTGRGFVWVKLINVLVGLAVGLISLLLF